jgi:DNA-binding transcriptional ArsR family regulator
MQDRILDNELCESRCIHEDRVALALAGQLPGGDVDRLTRLFKAIGDPSRLRVLWALSESEMCVCDIAAFLKVSESAVSHQLRQLRQLDLVANRRQGPILYYRLCDDHVTRLIKMALDYIHD